MKTLMLTLSLAWATAAHADVAVPSPAKSWADSCAARIDAAAKSLGLKPGARVTRYPLLHEDGTPNTVYYVEYNNGSPLAAQVGDDAEPHENLSWQAKPPIVFRRFNHRFGKIFTTNRKTDVFMAAVDDCLKMGDPK